ncbi:hypothetical protein DMT42_06565 [Streptomyces actuosus]|uniref:Uncharacterized protein n=1 Tax=Streptomyces actuosus TaxID=1885 RepID=A0A2U9NXG8_STRAS|nr:hypothetical protein DMT42_06565 [Streptomyces actuosus]
MGLVAVRGGCAPSPPIRPERPRPHAPDGLIRPASAGIRPPARPPPASCGCRPAAGAAPWCGRPPA